MNFWQALETAINPLGNEAVRKGTAGSIGKAIDVVGNALGNPLPNWNLSESLQNYGGAPGGWVWVKPAQAAEPQPSGGNIQPPPNTSVVDTKSLLQQPASPPSPQPSGGSNQMDQLVNAMVQRGGYDPTTARQVAGADFGRFWNEFMNNGSGTAQASAEAQAREKAIRDQITSTYNNIISRLDKLAGLYPQWQQQDIQNLQQTRQNLLQGVQNARQTAEQKIGSYRADVQRRRERGITKIEQDLRNLLKATGMQLGAMGAGSSSASQIIAPYAISKQGARAEAQVIKGANDQLAQLDRKAMDVKSTYDDQVSKIEQSIQQEKQNIADTYRQYKTAIEQAKNNADQNRMQALNSLDASLLASARNRIDLLDAEARQKRDLLQQWAQDRLAQLDNYKLQLMRSARFSPQQLVWQEMQGIQNAPSMRGGGEVFYNPFLIKKKKLGQ